LSIELYISTWGTGKRGKKVTYTNGDRCHISLSPEYHPYQLVAYKPDIDPLLALQTEGASAPKGWEGVSIVDFE
jgi:hypothetical protein